MSEYHWNEKKRVWTRYDSKGPRTAVLSANLPALTEPTPIESHPEIAMPTRTKALDQAIEEAILAGSAVMQKGETSAILSQKKPIRHGYHIFLSIITLGAWLTPYLIIAVARGDIRYRLTVDRWGHVWPAVA
ncbi:hypothetical protein ACFQ0K_04245 [Nocardioides caeni]|uniref:Uncharacterized protein n=1 Tax=Nocardioides caeni TaxID=574700 RepID=A0A4V4HJJ1_9ACTN|nr:hypothetical protein [Nocardioides caeni]THV10726.1 hypothetical protein E9934_13375 [Nocardioides caeni]